jgi:hypothetical protein
MRLFRAWPLVVLFSCSDGTSTESGPSVDAAAEAAAPRESGSSLDAGEAGAIDAGPVRAPFGLDQRPMNSMCKSWPKPAQAGTLRAEKVFPNLRPLVFPVAAYQAPGDSAHWYARSSRAQSNAGTTASRRRTMFPWRPCLSQTRTSLVCLA